MVTTDAAQSGEKEVKSWGFRHVFTWTDKPNAHYQPHMHNGLTTHLIISGGFTICYPEDDPIRKQLFGPGSRIDVPAGKLHEVWIGDQGCTYIIGE